jgi:peptidoglycan hydrolase-like protein with peptidoglycan-binding domain
MKRTLIALFATAALAIPAVAQQQDPNQKADQNARQDQNKGQDQNGIMGQKTKEALKKYQSQKGLNASGKVDRQTLAALLSERGKQTASRKRHGMPSQHRDQGQQGRQ